MMQSKSSGLIICGLVYTLAIMVAGWATTLWPEGWPLPTRILAADIIATLMVWMGSLIFRNASIYDPYWSLAPMLIVPWAVTATGRDWDTSTLLLTAAVQCWGLRLTLNWVRGWRGLRHQDWRYTMLHEQNPSRWFFTNLLGIHLFPTLIVFAGLMPVLIVLDDAPQTPVIEWLAAIGAGVAFIATMIELVADEQLRAFKKTAPPGRHIDKGLWRYSRHPNYFGEVLFWVGLWIWAMGEDPLRAAWTLPGTLIMPALFLFVSIPMIEKKNMRSKPNYAEYMRTIPAFFPRYRR